MAKHTLSVLVENKPGVLARIAGLFSRRGYNIYSLAVSPTEDPRYSRMTVVDLVRLLDRGLDVVGRVDAERHAAHRLGPLHVVGQVG